MEWLRSGATLFLKKQRLEKCIFRTDRLGSVPPNVVHGPLRHNHFMLYLLYTSIGTYTLISDLEQIL